MNISSSRIPIFYFLLLMLMNAPSYAVESQGHRGARGLLPENTLHGFAEALKIGVHILELDVVLTSDDRVIVTHNPQIAPEIAKDTDGNWLAEPGPVVRSITLEEAQTYDVGGINPGSRYASRFPDQESRPGAQMPTLEQVIELVRESGSEDVRLNIETKLFPDGPVPAATPEHFAKVLIDLLRSKDFINRSVIQSFNWHVLKEVQSLEPGLRTSYLTVEQRWMDNIQRNEAGASSWTADYDIDEYEGQIPTLIKAAGGDVWSSYYKEVDKDSVNLAHELGLLVSVWTVNETDDMERLIEMGVDQIITDYPDRLITVMKKLNLPLPTSYQVAVD